MRNYWLPAVIAVVVCANALPAPAALDASMTITGSVQGTPRKDTSVKVNKVGIVVMAATHTNLVIVKNLVIAKGGCSDLIFAALMSDGTQPSTKMTNNPDGSCSYQLSFKPIGNTPPFGIKSFTLSSASNRFKPRSITDFTGVDWNGTKVAGTGAIPVSYVYRQIQWTWQQGGVTAQDDWESSI